MKAQPIRVDTHPSLFRQPSVQGVIVNKNKSEYNAFIKARKSAERINDLENRLAKMEQLVLNSLHVPKELLQDGND